MIYQAKKSIKILISILAITTFIFLLKLAFNHSGFFIYHYNSIFSQNVSEYRGELIKLARKDPEAAFVRFKEILKEDPLSYNNCHGIAHEMGHEVYEEYGFQEAMNVQNTLCGGGYIHGVIEGKFGILQEKEILKELPTVCAEGALICDHGIGHGLMIATDLDIDKSLSFCDQLPGSLGPRNCYDGVWMHIFDLEESGGRSIIDLEADITPQIIKTSVSLCENASEQYKGSCYFYLPRIFAHHTELPLSATIDVCENVESKHRAVCSAGSGHSTMKYHFSDPETALESCNDYNVSSLKDACREGSMLYYIYNTETTADGAIDLIQLCNDLDSVADQKTCLKVNAYRGEL